MPSSFSALDVVERIQHQPGLGEGAHQVPETGAPEAVLGDEAELGVHAAGILEPDLVDCTASVGVVEERGLDGLVVLDGDVVLDRQLDGPLVGDGLGPGDALDEGQRPVVAVVGDAQEDFFRWDLGYGVVQHRPDVGQRRNCHGRAVCIAPFI